MQWFLGVIFVKMRQKNKGFGAELLQNDTDWLQVSLWKPSDSVISLEYTVDFDVMVISFKGVSGKWLWFRPWPLHKLIQQFGAPDQLNNVTLILDCTVSPNKIFCSTFFKTLWVHWVYLIPLEYVSKIVQCHRLVGVFIKLRQIWLWAELCSSPLERYIKPEPQLGASRLQRLFMRPWLSNAKAMTLLSIVLRRPRKPHSLTLNVSPLLFVFFLHFDGTSHVK